MSREQNRGVEMHQDEFTRNYWARVWDDVVLPQEVRPRNIPEIHRILSSLLPKTNLSFLEIGCAPGRWMAYFAKHYNFSVSGIDYVSKACQKTIVNLRHLSVTAKVHHADLFDFVSGPYDVVFSAGFIEHFRNPEPALDKILTLCNPHGGLVISIIPSTTGLNRWISKTFRPHVAAGHFPITKPALVALHESLGLNTLYANYIESLHIIPPFRKNRFAKQFPTISFMLNLPFFIWNKTIENITRALGRYPKWGWMTGGILYVGKRTEGL